MPDPRQQRIDHPGRLAASTFVALAGFGMLVKAFADVRDRIPDGPRPGRHARRSTFKTPVPYVALGDVRTLPVASPAGVFRGAPIDRRRGRATTGVIVHPRSLVPVFDQPGGRPFASLPTALLGYDTWLPVIGYQTGWVRVLLPARPAGVTGWLDGDRLAAALTRTEIRIYLRAGRLHLVQDGRTAGIWPTESGHTRNSIPAGRTFLLAVRRDPRDRRNLPALPLAQPATNLWAGAGCATVVLHAGTAHDGCIGVPAEAMTQLAAVPSGSLVRLYS
jgi:hypothetical protein